MKGSRPPAFGVQGFRVARVSSSGFRVLSTISGTMKKLGLLLNDEVEGVHDVRVG